MTELERKENKEKTGVFTGSYAINPFSGKKIPIYVANYVLNNYATGMVMGVAAHDQRDFDFAKKFNLDIIPVIENTSPDCANVSDGKHINSDFLNGLNKEEAINKATEFVIKNNLGVVHTTTKLHD
jgi:leucyl-tRNA synthetase